MLHWFPLCVDFPWSLYQRFLNFILKGPFGEQNAIIITVLRFAHHYSESISYSPIAFIIPKTMTFYRKASLLFANSGQFRCKVDICLSFS